MTNILDLQITVAKLQEELTLYRNGISSNEFYELIKEKDVEINLLKDSNTDLNDKLRSMAKSSTNLLTKNDELSLENRFLSSKNIEQIKNIEKTLLLEKNKNNENLNIINEKDEENLHLITDISKLQSKCATLISEKTKNKKLLEKEKNNYKKELHRLESDMKLSIKMIEDLSKEKKSLLTRLSDVQPQMESLMIKNAELESKYAIQEEKIKCLEQELIKAYEGK